MGRKLNLKWVSETIGQKYKNWKNGDVIRIEAQTGTGKTEFIKTKLLDHAISNQKRILYICNRINLKRQMKIEIAQKQNIQIDYKDFKVLDTIEEIGYITITSYQKIQHFLLNEKYGLNFNDIYTKYLDFDYVVMDECHYIIQDSSFANKTVFFYEDYVRQYNKNCITILISATMDYIKDPIKEIYNDMNLKIYDYTTGIDYSYINAYYFKQYKDIINMINNDASGNKWLVFVNNMKVAKDMLKEIKDSKFVCSEHSKDANIMDKEELNNIISNGKYKCKCLIATKAIDNGVNINDPLVTNIVIMALDKIDLIQMLGRKRIDIKNTQEINLYIMARYKKSFSALINNKYIPADNEVNLWTNKRNEFNRKYDLDIDKLGKYENLFYKDKNGWQLNKIGHLMMTKHKEFCEDMVNQFNKKGESAFIREQLKWINLKYNKENWIEETLDNDTVDSLEQYLEERVDIKLFKNEQQKLKEFITKDFDRMINKLEKDRHKDREPGLKILNKLLFICEIPYVIVSKQEKNKKSSNNNKTYWLITNSKINNYSKKCHKINIV